MPNPLGSILDILSVLYREIKILPATGGAVEELQHPDQDEYEDKIINKDFGVITEFGEVPEPDVKNLYRPTPPITRSERHLFQFFVDGSIKTYFLGTGIEGARSFPIELAQVGAAVIKRGDDGMLKVWDHVRKVLLLLPQKSQGISDTVWEKIKKLEKPDFIELVDFTVPDVLGDSKQDPRDKAGAKARYMMHRLEIELIKSTDNFRNENCWLVLDGAVKFVEADIWDSWSTKWEGNPFVIGVAKSFRKDPLFQLGRRSTKRIDLNNLLAGLPHCHRTVAFIADEGRVIFWYVRIREQKEVDYPLMGVVKVEIPRPHKNPVPSELIDLLSRALVGERNVTPYGLDRRWHCTLYPIYIAEQVIKNSFFSKEVLLGTIRWPKL